VLIISVLLAQNANYQNTHYLQLWKYFLFHKFKQLFIQQISVQQP